MPVSVDGVGLFILENYAYLVDKDWSISFISITRFMGVFLVD